MKTFTYLIVSGIFSFAQAQYVCETKVGSETVTLSYKDGSYSVSHWGGSRNSYAASYEAGTYIRNGDLLLHKQTDFSTWKDMPETLQLTTVNASEGQQIVIKGLFHEPVEFSSESCEVGIAP